MSGARLQRCIPALLWAGLIFFLSSRNDAPSWVNDIWGADKIVHAGVYGVLCVLVLHACRWPHTRATWWAVAITSLYGASDEFHQGFVPGRTQDIFDWVADTTGAIVVTLLWRRIYAIRVRHRRPMPRSDRL